MRPPYRILLAEQGFVILQAVSAERSLRLANRDRRHGKKPRADVVFRWWPRDAKTRGAQQGAEDPRSKAAARRAGPRADGVGAQRW
jgi:hypothetical protein